MTFHGILPFSIHWLLWQSQPVLWPTLCWGIPNFLSLSWPFPLNFRFLYSIALSIFSMLCRCYERHLKLTMFKIKTSTLPFKTCFFHNLPISVNRNVIPSAGQDKILEGICIHVLSLNYVTITKNQNLSSLQNHVNYLLMLHISRGWAVSYLLCSRIQAERAAPSRTLTLLAKDRWVPTWWHLKILLERSTSLPFWIHWPEKVSCPSLVSLEYKDNSPRGVGPVGRVNKYFGNNIRVFDSFLSFRPHIQSIRKSGMFNLQNISRISPFYTTFTATSLVIYATISCLEYCNSLQLVFVLLPLSPQYLFLTQPPG